MKPFRWYTKANSGPGIAHPEARKETIAWIRSEFERNRQLTDVVSFSPRLRQHILNMVHSLS